MTPAATLPDRYERILKKTLKDLQDVKFALDASAIVAISNVRGDIIYANPKFCEISKYPREELIGRNHRILKSGSHSDAFYADMWRTITAGRVWRGEIQNRAKDGALYWVDTTIVPLLKDNGKPYRYVSIRYEITSRKAMEAEIHQMNEALEQRVAQRTAELNRANRELRETIEKLQESERLRETFISALTHDLRTPLVAQQRAFEIMDTHKSQLPERLAGLFERLEKSNAGLLEMVGKLLEINQYEAGKIHLRMEPVNLAELAGESLNDVSLLAESKGITLINRLKKSLPDIPGDRHQLKRVFINLIGNAVDHVPPDSRVELRDVIHDHYVEIECRDNGPGIAPDVLPHLFDRFFVVHRTRKKIGSGLGLYICKMIMGLHNGKIRVESVVGKGTSFFLTLPRYPSQPKYPSPHAMRHKEPPAKGV
ncbi:MAG: PAS domain-containing sensor histidine kinase [Vampirovibrionales bacterium]|nr:PAS domain-containing sensor histidine kinase [Vampirovibrionales bacterium]